MASGMRASGKMTRLDRSFIVSAEYLFKFYFNRRIPGINRTQSHFGMGATRAIQFKAWIAYCNF